MAANCRPGLCRGGTSAIRKTPLPQSTPCFKGLRSVRPFSGVVVLASWSGGISGVRLACVADSIARAGRHTLSMMVRCRNCSTNIASFVPRKYYKGSHQHGRRTEPLQNQWCKGDGVRLAAKCFIGKSRNMINKVLPPM